VRRSQGAKLVPRNRTSTSQTIFWTIWPAPGRRVDPALYGETTHPSLGHQDRDRDQTEIQLIHWALADGLPLLGICRGIQILNVARGGTLYQDIASQVPRATVHHGAGRPRDTLLHDVEVTRGSHLAAILGDTKVGVNSLHHQAVKDVASHFQVVARAPDGLVEGMETPNGAFCLAVQWHPEELARHTPNMQALFVALVEAAGAKS
jgi:putative glutamine amidotransferase